MFSTFVLSFIEIQRVFDPSSFARIFAKRSTRRPGNLAVISRGALGPVGRFRPVSWERPPVSRGNAFGDIWRDTNPNSDHSSINFYHILSRTLDDIRYLFGHLLGGSTTALPPDLCMVPMQVPPGTAKASQHSAICGPGSPESPGEIVQFSSFIFNIMFHSSHDQTMKPD